ncbi:TPA: hypothetical protein ACNVRW_005224 [Citrobacter freundii]
MLTNIHSSSAVLQGTIFSDTQIKPTKKFEFQVTKNMDGVFSVCQTASRIYPCGREVVKSCKTWVIATVAELAIAEFAHSRQGRLLIEAINSGKVVLN